MYQCDQQTTITYEELDETKPVEEWIERSDSSVLDSLGVFEPIHEPRYFPNQTSPTL